MTYAQERESYQDFLRILEAELTLILGDPKCHYVTTVTIWRSGIIEVYLISTSQPCPVVIFPVPECIARAYQTIHNNWRGQVEVIRQTLQGSPEGGCALGVPSM